MQVQIDRGRSKMGLSKQHDNSEVLGKVRTTLRSTGRGYAGTGKTLLDLVFPAIPLDTWITAKDVKLVIQETLGKDIALPDSSVSSAMARLKKEGSIRVRKFSSSMREYQRINKKKRYVNKALISNKTNKAKVLGADSLQAIANSLLVIEGALEALKEEHENFLIMRTMFDNMSK